MIKFKNFIRRSLDFAIPYPWNQGLQYVEFRRLLNESQYWSRDKIIEFQIIQLKKMIEHAYKNVRYYKRKMDEYGVSPVDIQDIGDIKKLPILEKSDLRKYAIELKSKNYISYLPYERHTSGSTGEPVHYLIDRKLGKLITAIVARHYSWAGIEVPSRIAIFRGTLIDKFGNPNEKYIERRYNETHYSTFRMTNRNMESYVSLLNIETPDLIRGYPSSLAILAEFIKNKCALKFRPKAVHVSSEVLTDEHRNIIESVFGCSVFNWYSHGESSVAAGECEKHNGLHINEEFGIVELIENDQYQKRIVDTSLWNYSMPIIRYDTEDLAEIIELDCACGRRLKKFSKIAGRTADIIIGKNGAILSPISFYHFWKHKISNTMPMKYYQVIQEDEKNLAVNFLEEDKNNINEILVKCELNNLLGNMEISFNYIDHIPSGQKWRTTISKLRNT